MGSEELTMMGILEPGTLCSWEPLGERVMFYWCLLVLSAQLHAIFFVLTQSVSIETLLWLSFIFNVYSPNKYFLATELCVYDITLTDVWIKLSTKSFVTFHLPGKGRGNCLLKLIYIFFNLNVTCLNNNMLFQIIIITCGLWINIITSFSIHHLSVPAILPS